MLKQRSQNGCLSLWKKVGSSNGFSQFCIITSTDQNTLKVERKSGIPYRANEALPTPLSAKRFNSPHPVSNARFALFALWHPQPHMTVFAIRVPLIHRESNVCIFEDSVSREAPVTRCRGGRRKEGISTFCAEEVLFVVGPNT